MGLVNEVVEVVKTAVHLFFYSLELTVLLCFFGNIHPSATEYIEAACSMFIFLCMLNLTCTIIKRFFINPSKVYSVKEFADVKPVAMMCSKEEHNVICVHEAGHAVVAKCLGIKILDVTAEAGKGVTKICSKKWDLMTSEDLELQAMVRYGGCIAEKCFFGQTYAGCLGAEGADLEDAEKYVRASVLISGEGFYCNAGVEFEKRVCEKAAILYERTKKIIMDNEDYLRKVHGFLIENERINEEELALLFENDSV